MNKIIKYIRDVVRAFKAVREDEWVQGTYYLDVTLKNPGEDIETFIIRAYKENLGEYRQIEVKRRLHKGYNPGLSNILLTGIV